MLELRWAFPVIPWGLPPLVIHQHWPEGPIRPRHGPLPGSAVPVQRGLDVHTVHASTASFRVMA